ncbi:hypothetical protein, partial [Sphingopyxis sp. KK2]|uniref:hypothetical protein n=1 Tax=Sphingopyxis sp. KK2 TaxID=1855727 RepID=UPI001C4DDDF5
EDMEAAPHPQKGSPPVSRRASNEEHALGDMLFLGRPYGMTDSPLPRATHLGSIAFFSHFAMVRR